ncbi:MAG: hypothetical protein GXP51_07080 [Deltaproteobacteria bacterium]|nr:hypothetical protein [Deltaproteobacteria bacterium]
METAILLIISAALLAYTLLPLFRPAEPFLLDVGARQRRRNALQQEKRHNLKAIKDIDFELATGKISTEDHEELRTLFSLKVADAIEAEKHLQDEEKAKDERE